MLDQLPTEVIMTIYEYLHYEDLKAVRRTCKKCYECSIIHRLGRKEVLHINERFNNADILRNLRMTERKFYHIDFSNVKYNICSAILEKTAMWIETLSFNSCPINFVQLIHIVKICCNLEKIRIKNCTQLLLDNTYIEDGFEKAKHVKTLEIINTNYLTDNILYKFFLLLPNIEYLSLDSTRLNCHQGVYQNNYRSVKKVLENPSLNVLTIQYLKVLIESKGRNLRALNFSNSMITNTALSCIIRSEGLHLERVLLNNCLELQVNIADSLKINHSLTELQLRACRIVTDDFLKHISETMPYLKILNISDCENFSDTGLRFLAQLENLVEFNISDCLTISSGAIWDVLMNNATHLKVLKLRQTSLNDFHFIRLLYNAQLIEIDVSFCVSLSNYSLFAIYISQKILTTLKIGGALINDEGLTGLNKETLPVRKMNLKKYRLTGLNTQYQRVKKENLNKSNQQMKLEDIQEEIMKDSLDYYCSMMDIGRSLHCVIDLSSLKSLNLSQCNHVTDAAFSIPLPLPNLKEMNLSFCRKFGSLGLIALSYNCPGLETLYLKYTNIRDISILVLVRKVHHLKNLSVEGCIRLTNVSMQFIHENCEQLRCLTVPRCPNISLRWIEKISKLPSVNKVYGKSIPKPPLRAVQQPPPPPPFFFIN